MGQLTPADTAAAADTAADTAGTSPESTDAQHHDNEGNDIVVTGVRRKAGDVLGGLTVLDSEELAKELRPSIGETLARQPGVTASSFGPTASRPILRGLSRRPHPNPDRRHRQLDVSASSPDHAVALNPLTAERIEVLRGPSALIYGSSAIGGVVNVIDRRIPRAEPEDGYDVNGLLEYGSAAEERSANLSVDGEVASHFVIHADGNWSKSDDLRTGGHLLTKELREEAAALQAEQFLRQLLAVEHRQAAEDVTGLLANAGDDDVIALIIVMLRMVLSADVPAVSAPLSAAAAVSVESAVLCCCRLIRLSGTGVRAMGKRGQS